LQPERQQVCGGVTAGGQVHQVEQRLLGAGHERELPYGHFDARVSKGQSARQVVELERPEGVSHDVRSSRPDAGDHRHVFGNDTAEREGRLQGYVRAPLQGVGHDERVGFDVAPRRGKRVEPAPQLD